MLCHYLEDLLPNCSLTHFNTSGFGNNNCWNEDVITTDCFQIEQLLQMKPSQNHFLDFKRILTCGLYFTCCSALLSEEDVNCRNTDEIKMQPLQLLLYC